MLRDRDNIFVRVFEEFKKFFCILVYFINLEEVNS